MYIMLKYNFENHFSSKVYYLNETLTRLPRSLGAEIYLEIFEI